MVTTYAVSATHLLNKPILQGLAAESSTQQHDLGYTVRGDDGKSYMYVKYDCSAVAVSAAGQPAIWQTSGALLVTSDTQDTDAEGASFAGVFTKAIADSDDVYIWIQTKGNVDGAAEVAGVAAGDALYCNVTEQFGDVEDNFDSTSDVFPKVVAIAHEAVDDTTSTGDITLLDL